MGCRRTLLAAGVAVAALVQTGIAGSAAEQTPVRGARGGFVLERAAEIARDEPGPHGGVGRTQGSVFFERVPGLAFSFRRRVLHPGASIGTHLQTEDEVYYVESGAGRMTVDGRSFDVRPGDGVLTRPGSTHAIVQAGHDDLALIIVFPTGAPAAPAPAGP